MPSPDHPLGVRRSPEGEMHGSRYRCKGAARARRERGHMRQCKGANRPAACAKVQR
jgi:hypothetical protein